MRSAAGHFARMLLALPERQLQTPPAHLHHLRIFIPEQAERYAGSESVLCPEGKQQIHPHPEQVRHGKPRLLFLLSHQQLGDVLQSSGAGVSESELSYHQAGAASSHTSASYRDTPAPTTRSLPTRGEWLSGGNGIGLRLRYLHLGTLGRNLRGPSAVPGHHSHLLPQEPEACLQMSQTPC